MTNPSQRLRDAGDPGCTPTAASVWLEIQRGRTRYPRRPVLTQRFLIGAGSNCHLQLGGDGMPFLHSLVAVEEQGVSIEAFVPWPELYVNDQILRSAQLSDGDVVTIGAFQFTVHLQASADQETPDPLYAPIPLEVARMDEAEEDLAALTATELVSRIEQITAEVEEQTAAERWGAASLLDAARQMAGEPAELALPAATSADASDETWARDLQAVSQDLERRLALLREREQEQAARADSLLAAQAKLAEQLELAARSLADEEARVRASA